MLPSTSDAGSCASLQLCVQRFLHRFYVVSRDLPFSAPLFLAPPPPRPPPLSTGNGYCDHENNKEECGEFMNDFNVGSNGLRARLFLVHALLPFVSLKATAVCRRRHRRGHDQPDVIMWQSATCLIIGSFKCTHDHFRFWTDFSGTSVSTTAFIPVAGIVRSLLLKPSPVHAPLGLAPFHWLLG